MQNQQAQRLEALNIDDSGFAFDTQTGESYTINSTGREILSKIMHGNSFEVIAIDMSKEYQQEKRSVTNDLQDYIQQLRALGLVEVSQ